jgi:hypothetical protein
MSQGSKTFYDNRRHSGLKTQKGAGDLALVNRPFRELAGTPYWGANPDDHYIFFVAVKAVGPVILMVLPSTVPVYFAVPAVNSMAAPRRRPWIA